MFADTINSSRQRMVRGSRWLRSRLPAIASGHSPIFVLGHQKAGTSAIAGLLGEFTGLTAVLDLRHEIQDQIIPKIVTGESSVAQLIRRNRRDFKAPIVKHPNLTLIYRQIRDRYPQSQFVFVVRDPRDNIRSVLDRLSIDGHTSNLEPEDWERMPAAWRTILGSERQSKSGSHIDALANRWTKMAQCYCDNSTAMELVVYEKFLADKVLAIHDLAARLGLSGVNEIDHLVNHPFQPRGSNRGVDLLEFFGPENLRIIESTCRHLMPRFGYQPHS